MVRPRCRRRFRRAHRVSANSRSRRRRERSSSALQYLRDAPTCPPKADRRLRRRLSRPGEAIRRGLPPALDHQERRVRVKVETDGSRPCQAPSASFPGPDWFERETYDLYGIFFDGHPDLRRILTDYGFRRASLAQGLPTDGLCRGPLRRGAEARRLRTCPNSSRRCESFDFLSPWEGARAEPLPGDEKCPATPESRRNCI